MSVMANALDSIAVLDAYVPLDVVLVLPARSRSDFLIRSNHVRLSCCFVTPQQWTSEISFGKQTSSSWCNH